jgi:hypothetical protein
VAATRAIRNKPAVLLNDRDRLSLCGKVDLRRGVLADGRGVLADDREQRRGKQPFSAAGSRAGRKSE